MVNRRRISYTQAMDTIKYPIGKFTYDKDVTPDKRAACIRDIAELPDRLRAAVAGLSAQQLGTCYREGGWTIRQVVHHLADSHMNAFIRFKLALTETSPAIKAYDQNAWAATADGLTADPRLSLAVVEGLHGRWTALLTSMSASDFGLTFLHPERGPMSLDHTLQMYAWHGRHHVAHVVGLRERMGWR
jgi:uncharacterized damage-inducible protein DinB